MLRDYAAADPEFAFVALRYFNVAGTAADGSLGEDHDPETHLIPVLLQTALGKREKVVVFGTDYPTPDGTCIRDYIHVEDLCDAHIVAMNALAAGRRPLLQPGHRPGLLGPRGAIDAAERVVGRRDPGRVRPAPLRRPGHPLRRRRQDPPRTGLVGPVHGDRADRRHGLAVVRAASGRISFSLAQAFYAWDPVRGAER